MSEGAGARGAACDVWWVRTGHLDWRPLATVLDAGESGRLRTLRQEADRERFVLAAVLARAALGRRLGVAATEVRLERRCPRCGAPHGPPRLGAPAGSAGVSITHSGGLVGVAVTGGAAVGLDVEAIRGVRDVDGLARSVLNGAEQQALDRYASEAGPPRRAEGFLRLWTRKEALTKMTGQGLAAGLDGIHVSGPSEAAALRSWAGQDHRVGRTTLHDLTVPRDGHVAAVAVDAPGAAVRQHDGLPLLAGRPRD